MAARPDLRRRLAVILAADVVGYSSLAERDEAGTLGLLRRLRERVLKPTLARHKGRLFKEMGDGFLAEFAHAADGLKAALDLQRELAREPALQAEERLRLRIGLHVGDVVIEGSDLLGDAVNVASRAEAFASPGGICLTAAVYEQVAHLLDLPYRPLGARRLKNMARTVTLFEIDEAGLTHTTGGGYGAERAARPPLVAVLPLDNLSGDQELQHLCDGIAVEVIGALSRFHSIKVLSAASSFAFRGLITGIRDIARTLKADYVLQGSLTARGRGLRLIIGLIDGDTTTHCWGETYDCAPDEIPGFQSHLAEHIAGMLEDRVFQSRLSRIERAPAETVAAYDCWLRGQHLLTRWTAQADQEALQWFGRAILQDPRFARAHASTAAVLNMHTILLPGNPHDAEDRQRAMKHARLAVELDDADARNHLNLAWGLMLARDFRGAARHFSLAERLNPNAADILIACALGTAFQGEAERARGLAARAIDLNPLHPDYFLSNLVMIRVLGRDYEEAVDIGRQVHERLPELSAWLAAALCRLGRLEEARLEARTFVAVVSGCWADKAPPTPQQAVDWFMSITALKRSEDRAILIEGFAAGGLPVGAWP